MTLALAVETSTRWGSLALLLDDGRVDEHLLDDDRAHARGVAPAIESLLSRNGLRAADLRLIVVGTGPGGYTGLRIGIATAKTLSFALGIPLVGLPSTLVLAGHEGVGQQKDPSARRCDRVLVALDANKAKGLVYTALYGLDRSAWAARASEPGTPPHEPEELAAPAIMKVAQAAKMAGEGIFVVGDGLDAVRRQAARPLEGDGALHPRARDALTLGVARAQVGRLDDERAVLPLYLRPSEAEILWARRHQAVDADPPREKNEGDPG